MVPCWEPNGGYPSWGGQAMAAFWWSFTLQKAWWCTYIHGVRCWTNIPAEGWTNNIQSYGYVAIRSKMIDMFCGPNLTQHAEAVPILAIVVLCRRWHGWHGFETLQLFSCLETLHVISHVVCYRLFKFGGEVWWAPAKMMVLTSDFASPASFRAVCTGSSVRLKSSSSAEQPDSCSSWQNDHRVWLQRSSKHQTWKGPETSTCSSGSLVVPTAWHVSKCGRRCSHPNPKLS